MLRVTHIKPAPLNFLAIGPFKGSRIQRDARRITASEIKYMRRTAGYGWTDYKTNTQIIQELKITPILDKLLEYKRNWIQRVNGIPCNRLPRVIKFPN
jgi:hypothetical protein